MPTKTNLGGVFMTDMDNRMSTGANISTEFVCGLIFDVNGIGTIDTLLTGDAAKNFANGNVVELNGTSDIKDVGITGANDVWSSISSSEELLHSRRRRPAFVCFFYGFKQ